MTLRDIIEVRAVDDHRLHLVFDDGVEGVVDFSRRLEFIGVFAPLADPAAFARVRIEYGALEWPTGASLDAQVLYSIVTGEPIPGATGPAPLQER